MKEVKLQNLWSFELGTEERIDVPIWIVNGFQQKSRQDSQNLNTDMIYKLSITSASCIVGTKKYPNSAILLKYDDDDDDDDDSQGNDQIKKSFKSSNRS